LEGEYRSVISSKKSIYYDTKDSNDLNSENTNFDLVQVKKIDTVILDEDNSEIENVKSVLLYEFLNSYCKTERSISTEMMFYVKSIINTEKLIYNIGSLMSLTHQQIQEFLEEDRLLNRVKFLYEILKKNTSQFR
jgi:ATP-dependent Lon protease